MLILHQHGLLMLDIDDLADISEVEHNMVDTADGMVGRDGPHKQHLRRTVFQ